MLMLLDWTSHLETTSVQVKLKLLSIVLKVLCSLAYVFSHSLHYTTHCSWMAAMPLYNVGLAAPFAISTCHCSPFLQGSVHTLAPPDSLSLLLWSELLDPPLRMNTDLSIPLW